MRALPRSVERAESFPVRLVTLPGGKPASAGTYDDVEKIARRQVDLNGQETWQDIPDGQPPAAGGGAMQMPPQPQGEGIPGATPGISAGAEPPRWDGGQQAPHVMSVPDVENDQGVAPSAGRVASPRPRAPWPNTYMDGYWPSGQEDIEQPPESSPGAAAGVPPSGMGPRAKTKKRAALAAIVKVGPEGYIHGYICVRPPCGRYHESTLDKKRGLVLHDGVKIGRVPSKDADGKYSAVHFRTDAAGVEVKERLPARYSTPREAFAAIPVYHNLQKLNEAATDHDAKESLATAQASLASGDLVDAAGFLENAYYRALENGDDSLASHIQHTRGAITDEDAPEPVTEPQRDWRAAVGTLPSTLDMNMHVNSAMQNAHDLSMSEDDPEFWHRVHDEAVSEHEVHVSQEPDAIVESLPASAEKPVGADLPEAALAPQLMSTAPLSPDPPQEAIDLVNEAKRLDDEAQALEKSDNAADRERAYYLKYQAGGIRDGNLSMEPGDPGYAPRTVPQVLRESGVPDDNFDAVMAARQKTTLLASNEEHRKTIAAEAGLTLAAADGKMREELRGIAAHRIATRTTNSGLEHILDDNAFKTQFETNKSKALKSNHTRAVFERAWFGYPESMNPAMRPVYGYVTDGVDRPAGIGVNDYFGFNTDQLSSFGITQVILKDAAKQRVTFNIGDSLNNSESSMPSPMLDPDARSYAAYDTGTPDPDRPGKFTYKHGIMQAIGLRGWNKDITSPKFRQHQYVEVQVHSPDGINRPLTPTDIDHVLFDKAPPKNLRDKLDTRGIPWKVWNAEAIAKDPAATAEEKSRALQVTQEDLAHTREEIARTQARLDEYAARHDQYSVDQFTKDLKTMTAVRERLEKGLAALQKTGVK
jgi:hypothetical protein